VQVEAVSVIIPCFNEEDTVAGVLEELSSALRSAGVTHEIIVVDDGSTDRTAELLAGSDIPACVIRHRVNRGYGASIKAGVKAASHDYVLITDADGQHSPESVLELLRQIEDYDMAIGARQGQGSHYWRVPGKMLLKIVSEILVGARIPDINSGLRIAKTGEVRKYMHLCSDQFSFSTSITLAFLGDRMAVKYVPVQVRGRQGGASSVRVSTGLSTFMLILRTIGTFNPLRIFMPPTIMLFVLGVGVTAWELWWKSNVSDLGLLFLISSVLLFCFSLLADQISLLRREINKS